MLTGGRASLLICPAVAVVEGQSPTARAVSPLRRGGGANVCAQAGKERAQRRDFVVAEALAESAVELDDRGQQRCEEPLALGGELDDLRAAVLRQPSAKHEAGALHPVEVMGEGGALDADGVGDVALHR